MFKQDRTILIIALIAMVNMLGYGIIIPILYAYSKKFGLTDFQNGLLFASFSVCQFIATPVIGRLSDRYGRRPMLLVSIAGTALSFFIMAFAPNVLFLFIARMLDGLTAGNIPVAFAVISDTTNKEQRAKAFGLISAAFNFGFIFGPAISAITVGLNPAYPFIIAGFITITAVILTFLYLPETNKHMGEVAKGKLFDFPQLWHTLFLPNVGTTFLISLLFFLAFSCAMIYGFQPFTTNILKMTASQNASLFTMFGIVGLTTQTFIVGKFSKKFGIKKSFTIALTITALSFIGMFLSNSILTFVAPLLLLAFANNIAQTLIPTILSQETDAKSQGSMMGLNSSYQSIGMIIGPVLGGLIASISIPLTFLVGSILVFVCIMLSKHILHTGAVRESAFN